MGIFVTQYSGLVGDKISNSSFKTSNSLTNKLWECFFYSTTSTLNVVNLFMKPITYKLEVPTFITNF